MKTKEITERLDGLGVNWQRDPDSLALYGSDLRTLVEISEVEQYCVEVFEMFHYLPERRKAEVYSLATEYAATPIDERREAKKYIYKSTRAVAAQMFLVAKPGGTLKFTSNPYAETDIGFYGEFTDDQVASFPEEVQEIFNAFEKEEVTQ